MRAAIYNGQKDILLTELDTPVAGDNDIVVRNLYASICGTDVAVYSHGPNTVIGSRWAANSGMKWFPGWFRSAEM